jgi:hypothetical protein
MVKLAPKALLLQAPRGRTQRKAFDSMSVFFAPPSDFSHHKSAVPEEQHDWNKANG